MIRACPHCGTANRIPPAHLADTGRCGRCKQMLPPAGEPFDVDTAAFTEILRGASVPILVDFWAPWCGPCRMAAPEVARAAQGLAGRAIVLKVNTEENPMLAEQYNIRSIPNFAVFHNGLLRAQRMGLAGHEQLQQLVLGNGSG